jgi:hypothetical protein
LCLRHGRLFHAVMHLSGRSFICTTTFATHNSLDPARVGISRNSHFVFRSICKSGCVSDSSSTMALQNYRLINIDKLDPESSSNFPISTLSPNTTPVSSADVQSLAGQIRQLLRGGDTEGALRGALENAPYGGDDRSKVWPLPTMSFSSSYQCKNRRLRRPT